MPHQIDEIGRVRAIVDRLRSSVVSLRAACGGALALFKMFVDRCATLFVVARAALHFVFQLDRGHPRGPKSDFAARRVAIRKFIIKK